MISIIIASIHFQFTYINWTNQYFSCLGILEIISICFIIITLFIGFLSIIKQKAIYIKIFIFILFISFLFTLFLSIFIIIGTQIKYWNESLGCHTKYKGIFKLWNSIDIYLQSVDETFCSYKCPCYLNRTSSFKFLNNIYTSPYYNLWFISNSSIHVNKFQNCNEISYVNAYNNYLMRNAYFNYTLNQKKFDKYFSYFEKYFKCTGFCSLYYFNENTHTNSKIVKYLFSDVSEIPKHFGCLKIILNWLQNTLNLFACFFLLLFLLQFSLFILSCIYLNELNQQNLQTQTKKKCDLMDDSNKSNKNDNSNNNNKSSKNNKSGSSFNTKNILEIDNYSYNKSNKNKNNNISQTTNDINNVNSNDDFINVSNNNTFQPSSSQINENSENLKFSPGKNIQ